MPTVTQNPISTTPDTNGYTVSDDARAAMEKEYGPSQKDTPQFDTPPNYQPNGHMTAQTAGEITTQWHTDATDASGNPYTYTSESIQQQQAQAELTATAQNRVQMPPLQHPLMGVVQFMGAGLNLGMKDMDQGNVGFDCIIGAKNYDDVKGQFNTEALKQQEKDFKYNETKLGMMSWVNVAGQLARLAPFLGNVTAAGAGGAVVGAGTGAGLGAIAGAPAPEAEPATITSGALIGAGRGWHVGEGLMAAKIMSGQMYMQLREQGISDSNARVFGVAGGVAMGVVTALQLKALSAVGQRAAISALRTEAGQAALNAFSKNFILSMGKSAVLNQAAFQAQAMTGYITTVLAKMADNPKQAWDAPTIQKGLMDTIMQTLQNTGGVSLALGAGAHVVGGLGGVAAGSLEDIGKQAEIQDAKNADTAAGQGASFLGGLVNRVVTGKTKAEDAYHVLTEGLKAQEPTTQEEVDKVKNMSTEDALDAIGKPADSKGMPLTPEEEAKGIISKDSEGNVTLGGTITETKDLSGGEINGKGQTETQTEAGKTNEPVEPEVTKATEGPDTKLPSPELEARKAKVTEDLKNVDAKISQHEDMLQEKDTVQHKQILAAAQKELDDQKSYIDTLNEKLQSKEEAGRDTGPIKEKIKQALKDQREKEKEVQELKINVQRSGPTTAISNRLEGFYQQRDSLATEKEALDNNLLKPEDLNKGALGTLPIEKITSLRAKAITKILKGYQKGVREGTKITKQQVKSIQAELASVVRSSGLEEKNKAKFLGDIRNTQTEQQLINRLPDFIGKIDKLREGEDKTYQTKRFQRLMNQAELKKGGKYPIGKYTADIQKTLDEIRKAVTDKNYAADVANEMFQKRQNDEEFTPEDYIKAGIADQYTNLGDKTSSELKDINDGLKSMMEGGRELNLEKKVKKAEALQEVRSGAMDSIQGKNIRSTRPMGDTERVYKGWVNERWHDWQRFTKTFDHLGSSWDKLMAIVSQDDPRIGQGEVPKLVRLLDHNESDRNYLKLRAEWIPNLRDRIQKAIDENGKGDAARYAEAGHKVEDFGEHLLSNGKIENLTLSRGEARKLYAEMQDPSLRAGLEEGNKYTFEDSAAVQSGFFPKGSKTTEALLEDKLTPTDKAVQKAILSAYVTFHKEVINPAWREMTGTDLPFNEFYSPASRIVDGKMEQDLSPFDRRNNPTIKPASAITRVANMLGLKPQDDIGAAFHHIDTWIHFITHEEWHSKVSTVLGDPAIQYLIESKYGKGVLTNARTLFEYISRTGNSPMKNLFGYMNEIRANAATSLVGLRPVSFPKHIISAIGYLKYVNPAEFVSGVTHAILHPKEVAKTLNDLSPILRSRESNQEREFVDAVKTDQYRDLRIHKTFRDWAMLPVELSTAAAKYGGSWALFSKVLKATGDSEAAIRAVEKATKETQFGGGADTRSVFQIKHPFLSLFGTFPLKMAQIETEAYRNAANHGSFNNPTPILNALKVAAIFHFTLPVLSQIVSTRIPIVSTQASASKEGNTDLLRTAILGSYGELPIFGDLLKAGLTVGTNAVFNQKDKVWEPQTLLTGAGTNILHGGQGFVKFAANPDLEHFIKTVNPLVKASFLLPAAVGGGLPIPAVTKMLEWMFHVDTSGKSKENSDYDKIFGSGAGETTESKKEFEKVFGK